MKTKRVLLITGLTACSIFFVLMTLKTGKTPEPRHARPEGPDDEKLEKGKMFPGEWMTMQRAYPYGRISQKYYLLAMNQACEFRRKSAAKDFAWVPAGPTNVGGRITDIEIPAGQPATMYVGAATGGLFKTTDNGLTWTNVFADYPCISVGDIAIDPSNPGILYLGTGEANVSSNSFLGDGIYKSVDGGLTWAHAGLDSIAYTGRVLVDYSNTSNVYVAASGTLFTPNSARGIYKSTDGGLTWQQKLFVSDTTAAIDLVQHPTNPLVLYAAMWERTRGITYRRSFGPSSGIYKTTDGGDNWVKLAGGLPNGVNMGRIGLAIAPSSPETLYAFIDLNSVARVYKTTNGGSTWTSTNDGTLSGMNSTFGWYFGQIRVDPDNANRAYVLGVEMYRTDNGGSNWTMLADYSTMDMIHVDHHAMEIEGGLGTRIVEGNDGGLYFSNNLGANWTKINNLPISQFYTIENDFQNPARIYGGMQDNGTNRTLTGALNDWEQIYGGDGFRCLVDYTSSNTIYAEYQYGELYKSTDGGYWFNYLLNSQMQNDRKNWSTPYIMSPQDHNILYFGTYRVWKTTNGGSSWTAISGDLTKNIPAPGFVYSTITTLAASPLNAAVLIAGTDDGNVQVTANGGQNWTNVSAGLPDRWITGVAADPFDQNTVYCTVSGFRWSEPQPHVFRSANLGASWTDISSNLPDLPVDCIVLDPLVQGRIFIGTDAGVFTTTDGGANWSSLAAGMPAVPVIDMKLHPPTRTLILGTYGCSSYKIDIDHLVGTHDPGTAPEEGSVLGQSYPIPFMVSGMQTGSFVTFSFRPGKAGFTTIDILDMQGRRVRTLIADNLTAGLHEARWDGKNNAGSLVKPGVYFYRMNLNGSSLCRKFLVL